jgi:hypothetical protein
MIDLDFSGERGPHRSIAWSTPVMPDPDAWWAPHGPTLNFTDAPKVRQILYIYSEYGANAQTFRISQLAAKMPPVSHTDVAPATSLDR